MRTTQVDSGGIKRRLKLKGDPETKCSNRWWQVGNNGGMAAARWLMGLLRECWSLLAIPAASLPGWLTYQSTHTHTHDVYTRAFLPPEKTRGPTSFFKRPFIQDCRSTDLTLAGTHVTRLQWKTPSISPIWKDLTLAKARTFLCILECDIRNRRFLQSWTFIGK